MKSFRHRSLKTMLASRCVRAAFALAGLVSVLAATNPVQASVMEKKWRFPVGVSYISGVSDVVDAMEAADPYIEDVTEWPVGLHFDPYYSINDGLGIGGSVGPIFVVLGDIEGVIVPLGLDVRYNFAPKKKTSAYVRAGVRHLIADGDLFGDTSIGFYGSLGVSFNRDRAVAWALEASIDTSKIEITNWAGSVRDEVKPLGFMFGIAAEF
jgi:hypothetical protein